MKANNMKINMTNIYKAGFTVALLAILLGFVSCKNPFSDTISRKADNNTYLMICDGDVSINSRTINPSEDYALENLTEVYLYALKTKDVNGNSVSVSERVLAGSASLKLSDLYTKQLLLEDGAGEYTIRMRATLDGIYFHKRLENVQITANVTNPVSIALEPVKSSSNLNTPFDEYGGFSFTINADIGTANVDVDSIYVTLKHLESDEIVEQRYINRSTTSPKLTSKTVYSHSANVSETQTNGRVPAGTYRITFDFLALDQSLNQDIVINSYSFIMNVLKGRNTYYEETFELNKVYTITYNDDGGTPDTGEIKRTKFTSKDEVDLPFLIKNKYTFLGWKDENGDPIEKIEKGTTTNKTVYAQFAESVLYVDANGNDDNDGLSAAHENDHAPLLTLGAALAKIKALDPNDKKLDWYIYMAGNFTTSGVLISDWNSGGEVSEPLNANSITIVGTNGLSSGVPRDSITGDGTQPVFTIRTEVPICFRTIQISGGKNISGSKEGGGISLRQGTVAIEEGTLITGNSSDGDGAGIYVYTSGYLCLTGGKIQGNTLTGTDKHGADIYWSNGGTVVAYGNPVVGDIYVPENNTISLIGNMTRGASITMTPQYYSGVSVDPSWHTTNKTPMISVSSTPMFDNIEIKDNNDYFSITPQEGSDVAWFVDDNGWLNQNYTVTFKGEGIQTPITKTVPGGGGIPLADDPAINLTREGYLFNGWGYIAENDVNVFGFDNGEEDFYNSLFTHVFSDLEVYATWVCNTDELHVSVTNELKGVDFLGLDSSNEVVFGDGSETAPFYTINCALDTIRMLDDSSKDYTIVINGKTEEYNIRIDNTIPSKSITLQGKNATAQGAIPADGIFLEDTMYTDLQSLIFISENANVILQNIQMQMSVRAYEVDGIALRISSGATVTLGNGATFIGNGSNAIPRGAIYVDDASLIMNEGALIKGFSLEKGAVYVKNDGSFTMEGGSIINNDILDTGAVYVNGGEFIMNGGSISGNTTIALGDNYADDEYGAGVCVASGTFTMNGGYITNNKAYVYNNTPGLSTAGGGVFVYSNGTFVMTGGEISGNAAIKANIAYPETIIDGDYAYGGGVCLQASGTQVASFRMTGGKISGNTAGTSGNGIGFIGSLNEGETGTIYLGDEALITPDNDVYLPSFMTITIVSSIMDDNDNPIKATITPQEYKANQQILDEESVNLDVEYDYFGVTPAGSTAWEINEEGKLTVSSSGGNGAPEGFVVVPGTGSVNTLYVSKNLVTQTEYEQFMTYHGDAVSGSTYKPASTDNKSTTPAYYITWVDAIIYCNLRSKNEGLTPVYRLGNDRNDLTNSIAEVSEWVSNQSFEALGVSSIGTGQNTRYYFNWDGTKPMEYYNSWDSIYDYGNVIIDETATGYRLPTSDEIEAIVAWNVENDSVIQSYKTKSLNEWCDGYSQNTGDTIYFTGDIADDTNINFNYKEHASHEETDYDHCGGGSNITSDMGFRVVRNASENP